MEEQEETAPCEWTGRSSASPVVDVQPVSVTTGARTRGQTLSKEPMTGRHRLGAALYLEEQEMLSEEEYERRSSGYRSADTDTETFPCQRLTLRAKRSKTRLGNVEKTGKVLFAEPGRAGELSTQQTSTVLNSPQQSTTVFNRPHFTSGHSVFVDAIFAS